MFLTNIFKLIFNKQKSSYSGEGIKFPAYDELSYEQKEAVNLPFNKTNVVLGAPGTGKTIVAIHRIHKLYEVTNKKIKMLVYNRALYNYIVEVQKELGFENEFEVSTVNDFVYYDLYNGAKDGKEKNIIDKDVPHIGNNKYNTDWKQVLEDVRGVATLYDHIVIDEGQDFNEYFYKVIKMLAKHITLFADPNQAIQNDSASLSKILEILGKEAYFVLTLNYRNSKNVVDFTRRYCYDKSIFAESYKNKDDLKILPFSENDYVERIISIIKQYNPNTNIGVIVPNIKNLQGETDRKYEKELYNGLNKKLGGKYKVQNYYNDKVQSDKELLSMNNVNFAENSIKIFNYSTIRGLDFDIVILLDFISSGLDDIEDDDKKVEVIKDMNKLYIASTRGKDKLFVLKKASEHIYFDNDITYGYFEPINGIGLDECLNLAKNADEEEKAVEAMYYYHYALSVLGIEDRELLKRTICSFANKCINHNKADFALGVIFNYSYKFNEIDDEDLIFFYQSALIHSYNSNFVYNNLDKFFNRIVKLKDEDYKDYLIEEFYNGYLNKCMNDGKNPDKNYAIDQIVRHKLQNYQSYKDFLNKCDRHNSGSEPDEATMDDEIEESEKERVNINTLTGHQLLMGSYITIIGQSDCSKAELVRKAESKGYIEDDFDFNIEYESLKSKSFDYIRKDCDKPIAVIYAATPHKLKNIGKHSSLLSKLRQPGYPKVFAKPKLRSLSLSAFKDLLEQIVDYLKERARRNRILKKI